MTWWPSVPTSAVIAPTIAGSSSTTRMRRGRVDIVIMILALQVRWRPRPAGRRRSGRRAVGRLAPQAGAHRFAEALGGVQADARAAGGVRVAAGVRLEDPLAPLVGDARPLVGDAELDDALDERPVDRDRRLGRRVLDGVLDEVLEDLAEARRVGQARAAGRSARSRPGGGRGSAGASRRPRRPAPPRSTGVTDGGILRHDPDRGEDRVDEAVEPLDLLERRAVPRRARLAPGDVARLAAAERRLVGQQVGVRADDRERRPQLVGDERDQLAAGLVDRLERLDAGLGLGLLAALLDDPGEQVGDRAELGDVVRR